MPTTTNPKPPAVFPFSFDCAKCSTHVEGSSIHPEPKTLCFDCERCEENKAAGFAAKPCASCAREIAPRSPEATLCFPCAHAEHCASYEVEYADVVAFLQEQVNANTSMTHTGGGCMAIEVDGDGFYLLVTDDEGPLNGCWGEATGWLVGVYDDEGERFDGATEEGFMWAPGDTSLQALGALMERFIAHLRTLGIDAFHYGEV